MDLTPYEPYIDLLKGLGALASFGAFVVSLLVKREVRELKQAHLRRGRLPELVSQIDAARARLSDLLADEVRNDLQIREHLAKLRGTLASLVQVVAGPVQNRVLELDRAVESHVGGLVASTWRGRLSHVFRPAHKPSEKPVRDIYVQLWHLGTELSNQIEDDKWRDK